MGRSTDPRSVLRLTDELYRRNVVRAGSAYLAFAWLAIEAAHLLDHALGIPNSAERYLVILLAIGLIPTVLFSWRYELTQRGLEEESSLEHPKLVHHAIAALLDRVTIVLLSLAFLLHVVDQFAVEPPPETGRDTAAVSGPAPDHRGR